MKEEKINPFTRKILERRLSLKKGNYIIRTNMTNEWKFVPTIERQRELKKIFQEIKGTGFKMFTFGAGAVYILIKDQEELLYFRLIFGNRIDSIIKV